MFNQSENGLSPVIAAVLLVAVTVALVSLIAFVAFQITDKDVENSISGSSVDMTATQDGITVTVLRPGNADRFIVRVDGENKGTIEEAGDTLTVPESGLYSIIGEKEGTEEVIRKERITGVEYGDFVVYQDPNSNSLDAELVQEYKDQEEYDIAINSENNTDGSTANYKYSMFDESSLLSSRRGTTLQALPSLLPDKATNIVGITADPSKIQAPIQVGERADLDSMLGSWCEGDELLLVGQDGETVLDGEEITFDNNCGGLRTVTQFANGEITGTKLVNLWSQDINYSVLAFKGIVEPPQKGIATDGQHDIRVEVYEQGSGIDTSSPVEDAQVVIGNKQSDTNSTGVASFSQIPGESDFFVTVNSNGFFGTQTTFEISEESNGDIKSILFDEFSGSASSDTSNPSTSKDDGKYVVTEKDGVKTIIIGLSNPNSRTRLLGQGSIPSGGSESISIPDGETYSGISISGGSESSSVSRYDGSNSGTVDSGSTFYSGSESGRTTQTLSANSNTVVESSDPIASISGPQLELSTIPVDESQVPTGEEIRIQVNAQNFGTKDVTDDINIYKTPVNADGSANNILSRSISLPGGDDSNAGPEVSETIKLRLTETDTSGLVPSEAGSWNPGTEYVIYAALESVGELREVGTINVFDGSLTNSELQLSDSSISITDDSQLTSSQIDKQAYVGDELTMSLDSVVKGGASGETIDIIRNGNLVKRVDNYQGGSIEYTETLNESQYVSYHIGIMESQDTSILSTLAVYDVDPTSKSGIADFQPNITISDRSNCDGLPQTSGNYDCEIQTSNSISFKIGGTFDGIDLSKDSSDLSLNLNTGGGYNQQIDYGDNISESYSKSGLKLVNLTATYNTGSGTVKSTDTLIINSYKPIGQTTTEFTENHGLNVNEISIGLRNDRTEISETVDIKIESGLDRSNASGTYRVNDFKVQPQINNQLRRTVVEIAGGISGSGSIYTGDGGFQDAVDSVQDNNGEIPLEATIVDENGENVDSYNFSVNPDEDAINTGLSGSCTTFSSDRTLEAKTYTYTCLIIEEGVTITAKGDPSKDGPNSYGGVKIVTQDALKMNGVINANTNGYGPSSGPGGSGSYAGYYGGDVRDRYEAEYGSKSEANRLGSGTSGMAGGGSVWLKSESDSVEVNGKITADGSSSGYWYDASSGGSIRIDASSIKGSGILSAEGGDGGRGDGGGGGRIALYGTNDHSLTTDVSGGNSSETGDCDYCGGGGTLYETS